MSRVEVHCSNQHVIGVLGNGLLPHCEIRVEEIDCNVIFYVKQNLLL